MSEKKYPVKRGGEYELQIDRLAFGGAGVARVENYVVFVKGALPGETVKVRIQKRKSGHAEARLLEIIKPSPERQQAACPYFEWCGGCTWQSLTYADQLKHKQQIVAESLRHLAGETEIEVRPVLPSEADFAYRNKMEFSFSDRRWLLPDELGNEEISRDFALGLHVPGTFDKIIQIDRCLLQSERANRVLELVNRYVQEHGLTPYGIRSHQGFLRFLVIRQSRYNGEVMVNIVTSEEDTDKLRPLAEKLIATYPFVSSVINNINSRPAQIAMGEKEIVLAGNDHIVEELGGFLFKISANSFFQTNSAQAERLYEQVLRFADIRPDEIVWDLYAGTGTISLFLAQKAKEVIGFELVESAVADAEKNAGEHGVNNARFVGGDLLHKLRDTEPKPDVLVTDPPRSGMHEKVVRYIAEMQPERLVYVSCNPTTLARDLAILKERYRIEAVQPVDMFPQTYHIETVVKLKRR